MKQKNLFLLFLFLTCSSLYGQNNKLIRLNGSWMGDLILPDNSTLTCIMNFKVNGNLIKATLDVPAQSSKDLFIDSTWVANDSVFTDHSSTLGPGTSYKGSILPGDSVIDGKWFQGGGQFQLKFRPTNYVYTRRTRLNPKFEGYKIIKLIESTPPKDQQQSNVCWSFATTSFIETEAIRQGKKPVALSPMFFVIPTYPDKAERYIRVKGKQYFGPGDLTFSVLKAYKNSGAIPEDVYSGKIDTSAPHDDYKMSSVLRDKVKQYVESGYGNMSRDEYRKTITDILYHYMGRAPETFNYQGNEYTSKSFAEEKVGINPDDYIEITSYSHHPFYSKFSLEMESNWNNNFYLNLPINDFINVIDNALLNNYSLCWDGDIRQGYNDGFCKLDKDTIITQVARQTAFDNYTTQDIHNMHIIGITENNEGKTFYIVKNSTSIGDCGGYLYMSKDFLLLKTISVMVHKNAIPKDILKKIKIT